MSPSMKTRSSQQQRKGLKKMQTSLSITKKRRKKAKRKKRERQSPMTSQPYQPASLSKVVHSQRFINLINHLCKFLNHRRRFLNHRRRLNLRAHLQVRSDCPKDLRRYQKQELLARLEVTLASRQLCQASAQSPKLKLKKKMMMMVMVMDLKLKQLSKKQLFENKAYYYESYLYTSKQILQSLISFREPKLLQ